MIILKLLKGRSKGNFMIQKKFSSDNCIVEFSLPHYLTKFAKSVSLIGDFNNWNDSLTPMIFEEDTFRVTVLLRPNEEYAFLYRVVEDRDKKISISYVNDWNADKYVPGPYVGSNSVVMTYEVVESI